MKTSELTGLMLDQWVAKANGVAAEVRHGALMTKEGAIFQPSEKWAQAGPIIEREKMYLEWDADGYWVASTPTTGHIRATTPLVAAMRAFVVAYFGDTVPDEVPA